MSHNILHIDSSARNEDSVTRKLSKEVVTQLKASYPDAKVVYRDLTSSPLPHINPDFIGGTFGTSSEPLANEAVARSELLVNELFAADIYVLGAPMYNFGVPSQLKAWIDHICRKGKTFEYSEQGPKGLLTGKRAIIVGGTGGIYTAGPMVAYNHVTPYLKQVFGFLGVTQFEEFVAEKQGFGPEAAAEALSGALTAIRETTKKAA